MNAITKSGILAAVLAVCGVGCCQQAPLASRYRVVISPVFTAEDNQSILDALQDWEAITPVQFDMVVDANCEDADDRICIHPAAPNGTFLAWTERNTLTGRADISAYPLARDRVRQTIGHELGHAMGLDHVTSGSAIMWAEPWQAAATPTGDDAIQWASLR